MTSLERARALLKRSAKSALVIVPLAASVVPASAALIFNPLSATWNYTQTGSGGSFGSGNPTVQPFTNGVKVFGTANVGCDCIAPAGGQLILNVIGNGNGDPTPIGSSTYPAHFDFSYSGSGYTGTWAVTFFMNGQNTSQSGSLTPGAGSEAGNLTISGLNPASALTSWQIVFNVTLNLDASGFIDVTVPNTSLAIGSAATVPEPASVLLVLPGLVWVVARRFRK